MGGKRVPGSALRLGSDARLQYITHSAQNMSCSLTALARLCRECVSLFYFEGNIQTMTQDIVHITDASFEKEVLKAQGPVLVDYWAEWCGPCKMIAPVLEEIAREYAGKIKITKLNIDENPATPPKYGIRGIPTLMLFKNGNVEATKVGAVSKSQLSAFLDGNL